MDTQHRGLRLQRGQCILASAVLGALTMVAVLVAALVGAPESAIVSICTGGFAIMMASALISQFCK